MSIRYVDTNWYPYIIIFVCLLLLCLVILAGISKYEMYVNKKRYDKAKKEERKDFYEKNMNKNGDRFHGFMAAIMLSIIVIVCLVFWENKYNIKEEFAWTEEERKDKNGLNFPLLERETIDEILQYEKQLHMEWYNEKKGEYIDRKMVEEYEKKVNNIFYAVPEREDSYVEMKKIASDFEQRKKNYKRLVDSKQENLSSEKLWKGYEDGVEVCNVYNTSENVFQTGVLAESASENAHKDQTSPEEHLFFAGGAVNQFEQFIEFSSGNIGDGKRLLKKKSVSAL